MTKQAYKKLLEAARVTGVTIDSKKSGTQRVTAIIAGKTYGGINAAMDAVTMQYLKQKRNSK